MAQRVTLFPHHAFAICKSVGTGSVSSNSSVSENTDAGISDWEMCFLSVNKLEYGSKFCAERDTMFNGGYFVIHKY